MTIELAFCALLFATVVGIPLGMWSAYKRNSPVDVGTMVVANIGVSMPVFWLGLMLAYIFALALKDTPFQLPPSGRNSPGLIVPTIDGSLEDQSSTGRVSHPAPVYFQHAPGQFAADPELAPSLRTPPST